MLLAPTDNVDSESATLTTGLYIVKADLNRDVAGVATEHHYVIYWL